MKLLSLSLFLFLFSLVSFGQVANDDCANAMDLGTLPAPAACPSGAGTPQTFNLTNVNAIAENPYSSLIGCQSGFDMASPAADVWYSFTASGSELDVTVTGGLTNPSMGLYEGTCAGLVPRGCNTGTTQALFTPLTPGNTYYIQISGTNPADQAPFSLTLNNWTNCAQCLTTANLTVTPPPTNGSYQSGTTVTFCLTIDGYIQQSTNWLSAVVPTFGAGWDMTTLTPGTAPPAIGGIGSWIWTSNVTSTATGFNSPDFGWYFDLDNDGNPGNNFGDSNVGGAAGALSGPWQPFCWTITTNSCPPGQDGDDLGMSINTLADGEIGSWQSLGCANDPTIDFSAQLVCCTDPVMSNTDVLCNGGTDGTATAVGQGTGPWDYVWDDGNGTIATNNAVAGQDVITGLAAGTYNVTVTDTWNGCVTTGTVTITEPTALTATVATVDANCGATDGSATVTANNGTPNYTYVWYSDMGLTTPIGQTTAAATNLGAGTYYVEVTDDNGCTFVANGTVTNSAGPVINSVTFTDPLCNGVCDGTVTINVTGGTPGITYDLAGSAQLNNNVFTGVCAGTFAVTVTDANGCQDNSTVTLTDPPALTISTAPTNLTCFQSADGQIDVTAGGGTPPLQYSINGGALQAGTSFTGLSAGAYTVMVQDDNGCQLTINENVTEPTALTLNVTPTNVSCNGICDGSASSTVGGGTGTFNYVWSTSANTTDTEINLCAGNHTLDVTDQNGCTISQNFVITEPTPLTLTVATVDANCGVNDGSATATAGGGTNPISYEWFSDAALTMPIGQTTAAATNLGAGTFYVQITDDNGCQLDASGVVNNTNGPVINSVSFTNPLCNSACDGTVTINITGGLAPIDFDLDGAVQTGNNVFTGICAGTFPITVTDDNGCSETSTVTLTDPPLLTATAAITNLTCFQSADGQIDITGNGGTPPLQYSLNGGALQASNLFTGLAAGAYTVLIEDDNGCQVTLNENVTEPAALTLVVATTIANCGQADGTATATGGGGTPNLNYVWYSDAGLTLPIGQNTAIATNLAAGTYYVEITDDNGCTISDQGIVTTTPGPTLDNVAVIDETCPSQCDGQITITATGATGYSIDGGVTFQASNVFTGLCAGAYALTVENQDGCEDVGNAVVNSPPPIVIVPQGDTTICINGSATITASGAPAGSIYVWDNGLGAGQTHTVSPGGTTVYTVQATGPAGCLSNTTAVVVQLNPPVTVIALSDASICEGSSATISAIAQGGDGGPYSYVWDDSNGGTLNGSLQTVSPTSTTVYTVTADDGCETPSATAQITITVNAPPVVDFEVDSTSGCVPLTVAFNNLTPANMIGGTCLWDFGDGNASTDCAGPVHTYTSPGCYTVTLTVISPDGCYGSATYVDMVCVVPYPVANFSVEPTTTSILDPTFTFTNLSTGDIATYDWQFEEYGTATSQNAVFTFPSDEPGVYNVCLTVTSPESCASTFCQPVFVEGEFLVYLPNAITPDQDGSNDFFFARGTGLELTSDFTLLIFNRWGDLIFEAHDPNKPWDATHKGQMVQEDVYVWKMTVTDPYTGELVEQVGHVTVLR